MTKKRLKFTFVYNKKLTLHILKDQCIINAIASSDSISEAAQSLELDMELKWAIIKVKRFISNNDISKKDIDRMRKNFKLKFEKNDNRVKLRKSYRKKDYSQPSNFSISIV